MAVQTKVELTAVDKTRAAFSSVSDRVTKLNKKFGGLASALGKVTGGAGAAGAL